jgi:hypothetical protein
MEVFACLVPGGAGRAEPWLSEPMTTGVAYAMKF